MKILCVASGSKDTLLEESAKTDVLCCNNDNITQQLHSDYLIAGSASFEHSSSSEVTYDSPAEVSHALDQCKVQRDWVPDSLQTCTSTADAVCAAVSDSLDNTCYVSNTVNNAGSWCESSDTLRDTDCSLADSVQLTDSQQVNLFEMELELMKHCPSNDRSFSALSVDTDMELN